ncbi:MAG TPA: hypothetical protein VL481_02610 [Verrucomicrobiae bacterium]|nr:hypothetical protein [Verrucomicrobiae bacterium]
MALFSRKKQTDVPRRRQAAFRDEERKDDFDERYTFRRNRTITGSTSSQITSPGELNAQIKSPRAQAHELTRQRRHIGATLLLVLASAGVLFFLVSQFTAGAVVRATDVSIQLDTTYATLIDSYLSAQPLERLRFMTDTNHLVQYVQAKAPEVAGITLDGSAGLGKSTFVLTLREPTVGWTINGRQQYVDNTGTAFARNYFTTPAVQVVDKSGIQVEAGQAIASNRFLGFVGRAVALTKLQGFAVTQVIIPEGTTRQVALQLHGIRYPIKLSIDRGVGEQVEDMARAVRWLKAHGKSPQYLDVRVSGEAFYR